ncbi:Uncharacterized protein FWK35_00038609 [Aphis craccivora]|uniref:Uncharacterized protein n=1 Tax=Aphis craccivora TaxID=307492 RepID=A0A6G0VT25_APHCR|nr:Uncharacterized protein FWK35_00038609 [Aphis craccivora]
MNLILVFTSLHSSDHVPSSPPLFFFAFPVTEFRSGFFGLYSGVWDPNIINAINNRLKIEVIPSKRNKYKLHTFEFCLEEACYEIEDINNKIAKELSQVNNN